jgi:hypothetical protein
MRNREITEGSWRQLHYFRAQHNPEIANRVLSRSIPLLARAIALRLQVMCESEFTDVYTRNQPVLYR